MQRIRLFAALFLLWSVRAPALGGQARTPATKTDAPITPARQKIDAANTAFKVGSAAYTQGDLASAHAEFA